MQSSPCLRFILFYSRSISCFIQKCVRFLKQNGLQMQRHVDFKLKEYCDSVSDFVAGCCSCGCLEGMSIFTMFTSLFALMCQTGTVLAVATPPLYDATPHVTRPAERERDTRPEGAQISGLLL